MSWIGPAIIALAAIALVLDRRKTARFQANVLGGSIVPGCVVAEAIALLVLAALMFAYRSH